jgi:CRISPR-associated protein Cas5d
MRVRGELACFSRPEFAVERTSYPWITPSAGRALFEAVLWKPRIRWEIRQIRVLNPIRFTSFRRNEIATVTSSRISEADMRMTDDDRQQRTTTALTQVEYVLSADLCLNGAVPADGPADNHGKYREMFQRRLDRGQVFHRPYLGCREFAADVEPAQGDETAIPVSMAHGIMLYDFLFPVRYGERGEHRDWQDGQRPRPLYFDAHLIDGVVQVPPRQHVLQALPATLRPAGEST